MLQNVQGKSISQFNEGLYTGNNFLLDNVNQSPDCMDVKWNLDSSIQKRLGSSTTNTVALTSTAGWASFDFGATDTRWYLVAHGTGISASSNGATTFVNVGTGRTQTYQHIERSKNVAILSSEARDTQLYWAGSAGTQFITLAANSAPSAKLSINFQGFLILLNVADSNGTVHKRRFQYADDGFQLTSSYTGDDSGHSSGFFDFPSSFDDEVTEAFVLSKRLYVSTQEKLFRVTFVGGNPDWSFLEVKDWGFVPRTARKISLDVGEVVVGMDFNRRLRIFDGVDDVFGSGNIEKNNLMSDFAMNKINFESGSGLIVSHAALDRVEQEYRLNVAIGADSTETTHCIILNGRNKAFYPYSNQMFQTMATTESSGIIRLLAVDRSGYVHILNSGNQDVATPINEHYDSPIFFNKSPGEVSKGRKIDFYFKPTSAGTVHIQERSDFSSIYSPMKGLCELKSSVSSVQIVDSFRVPSVHNTWQFRLTSSSGTADPWLLNRVDLFQLGLGAGKGGAN